MHWRTCSFAVKSEIVQFVFCLLAIVLGGAAEELLPKFLGVGFPILLSTVFVLTSRRTIPLLVLFSIAAGAFEDALSGLPIATSASFFLTCAAVSRIPVVPREVLFLAYPFYQLWLNVLDPGLNGGVFGRLLLALPIGILTMIAMRFVLVWAERKAAVNEA